VAHAILLNAPLLMVARFRGDATAVRDRQCYAWLAYGAVRMTLCLLLPRVFPQADFFQELEFRKERQRFAQQADQGVPDGKT
jgi:hypothetical protein